MSHKFTDKETVKNKKGAYVSWANFVGRSQGFIDNLDLVPIYIKKSLVAPKVFLPLRYLLNSIETLYRLIVLKPAYIIVMSPPIFAPLSVFLYACLSRKNFIVDIHSGSLESILWKWSIPVLRIICRRAFYVFITNRTHYEIVNSWKSKPIIVGDPPPVIPNIVTEYSDKLVVTSPSIVVVNTYSIDEALEDIIDAARLCTNVKFFITGDKRKAGKTILNNVPENVILTGWLEDNKFWWLMKKCNAVLTLINQENTILRGGWEAMYLDQPLITSNTITLRDYFNKGTVFVENNSASISAGINYALINEVELRTRMEELRLEKINEWKENAKIIQKII